MAADPNGGGHEGAPQPRRHQNRRGGRPRQGGEGRRDLPEERGVPGADLPPRQLPRSQREETPGPQNCSGTF